MLPAAGAGLRFGEKKQFKLLGEKPLLFHSLIPFIDLDLISEIVVVVPGGAISRVEKDLRSATHAKLLRVVAGGNHRQDSVFSGVKALSQDCELICIHDAVRPFVTARMIAESIKACRKYDGAVLATQIKDTVKQVKGYDIEKTIPREDLWLAQTPQTFHRDKLVKALETANQDKVKATDEAALLERLGYRIAVVAGTPHNIKITTREDWQFAEAIWRNLHG